MSIAIIDTFIKLVEGLPTVLIEPSKNKALRKRASQTTAVGIDPFTGEPWDDNHDPLTGWPGSESPTRRWLSPDDQLRYDEMYGMVHAMARQHGLQIVPIEFSPPITGATHRGYRGITLPDDWLPRIRQLRAAVEQIGITAQETPKRKRRTIGEWVDLLERFESAEEDNPDLSVAEFARSEGIDPNLAGKMLPKAEAERDRIAADAIKAKQQSKTRRMG